MRRIALPTFALALLCLFSATPSAGAAVGVESVSRHSASPGQAVTLTLGCGFCYPPCEGSPARNTPCMLGTKRRPPRRFPISMVPVSSVPEPFPCGPRAICAPQTTRPPRRPPFVYLGEAVPPADIEEGREGGGPYIPRYRLRFEMPAVRPGRYAFVIFCEVCVRGEGGSLIAEPANGPWGDSPWSIRVRSPLATISLAEHLYSAADLHGDHSRPRA
jgi:hypothetical protein